MGAPSYLLMHVGDRSPGSAGFSMEAGQATETFFLRLEFDDPEAEDVGTGEDVKGMLEEFLTETLGTCTPAGDGSLDRGLPKAHPLFPWLFAQEITELRGVGNRDPQTSRIGVLAEAEEGLEAPPITDYVWVYPAYVASVKFASRPYAVVSNESIGVEAITWHDEDNEEQESTIAEEWLRYSDFDYDVSVDAATADHGRLSFQRGDGNAAGDPEPHERTFGGKPRVMVPKGMIRWRWFCVPFEYLTHQQSRFIQYVGYINQLEWLGWEPGELLYLGVRVIRRYTPPVPEREPSWTGSTAFSTAKLCDMELILEEAPRSTDTAPTPSNRNYVAAGHNLAYFLMDKKPHYVTAVQTDGPTDDGPPLHFSFPIQLLFTDPDVS